MGMRLGLTVLARQIHTPLWPWWKVSCLLFIFIINNFPCCLGNLAAFSEPIPGETPRGSGPTKLVPLFMSSGGFSHWQPLVYYVSRSSNRTFPDLGPPSGLVSSLDFFAKPSFFINTFISTIIKVGFLFFSCSYKLLGLTQVVIPSQSSRFLLELTVSNSYNRHFISSNYSMFKSCYFSWPWVGRSQKSRQQYFNQTFILTFNIKTANHDEDKLCFCV
jgi:hypothetical protein